MNEMEKTWYCRLCDKWLPSGPYCAEKHFDQQHPEINWRSDTDWVDGWFDTHCKTFEWDKDRVNELLKRLKI